MKVLNKKIIFILIFPLLISFFLICCERITNDEKMSNQWKESEYRNSFIQFDDKGRINLFDGLNELKGRLHFNKNVVYFKSENNKKLEFILFDFSLLKNHCIGINYSKKYYLCNQDVFYDKIRNDTIYKFCFKYYNMPIPKSSIVFFVGKKSGILGNYLIEHSTPESISICEKMFGEVYRERYHYENFPRFTIK